MTAYGITNYTDYTAKTKKISYNTKKRDRSTVKYIVIHYTAGNGDSALAEAKYFATGNARAAGAHFFIGQDGAVVQSVNMTNAAWSVGGAKYSNCAKTGGGKYYGKCTNANSVSIELCDNAKKDPSEAQIKAVKETIAYIQKYCKNAKTIIRHFDVTGKACPARMTDETTAGKKRWKAFKKAIS